VAELEFRGRVFSGLGRGAYYVGHPGFRVRFRRLLGYTPFPGTLNLRLADRSEVDDRARLRRKRGDSIKAFDYRGRQFSSVKCYTGSMRGEKVALTIPAITEYGDDVLEIIAPVRLRDALRLADDDEVTVRLEEDLLKRNFD